MKISPIAPSGAQSATGDQQANRIESTRSMKMTTNATPASVPPPNQAVQPAADDPPLPNSSTDESTAPAEETQPLSPQYAALAKQRRAIQLREKAVADKERALEQKAQGSAPADSVTKAQLKSDPIRMLLDAGVTWDELAQHVQANMGNSEVNALKSQVATLKQDIDQKFSDSQTQQEQQALSQMTKDAERIVGLDETYELVKANDAVPDVIRLIHRTYKESGELLDVSEALQLVEDELYKRATKLLTLKKLQPKPVATQPAQAAPQPRQGMTTLTNKDTASPPLSRKQRAISAFWGDLKK